MIVKKLEDSITKELFSKTLPTIVNEPYPHIVIDNFFPEDYFQLLQQGTKKRNRFKEVVYKCN